MAFGSGPSIVVKFLADTKDLVTGVDKVQGSGSKLKSFAKVAAGAFAVGSVVAFGKASFGAAEEAAQANARLEKVFRNVGDANGSAAKAAEDYANKLQFQTGIDDEVIKGAQAQLATFKAVSNETARGAGIFDRATSAAADLAAAGFGSIESNATKLGKALQDPVKYSKALAKSGVVLTQSQQDQIKAFQESGRTLDAQKLLLSAIEGRVGGTAAKTATSSAKMQVAWGELQETIGTKLMPVMKAATDLFIKYGALIIPIGGTLLGIAAATKLVSAGEAAWNAAKKVGTAIQWAWNAAMSANPIGLIVIALAALVGAVILAYKKVDWFRNLVDSVWRALVKAFGFIKNAALVAFTWIKSHWPLLLAILTGPFGLAVLFIVKNWRSILDFFKSLPGRIGGFVSTVFDVITTPYRLAARFVREKFEDVIDFFRKAPGRLANIGAGMFDFIKEAFRSAVNFIIRGWNGLQFQVPGFKVGPVHFGGFTLGLPDIPYLSKGGLVTSAGLAYLHPAEVVQPMSQMGGNTYYLHVEVPATADPAAVGRSIVAAIRSYEGVAGSSWRRTPTGRTA